MTTNTRSRVDKGVTTGGQFAKENKPEDGNVTLEGAKKWGLVVSSGASVEVGYDLSQAGLTGSLSPENDPDDNLHEGDHPQSRYTTPGGRNFTISKAPDGTHQVADADNRDDDGYVTVDGGASQDVADSVRDIVRERLAWEHAPSEELSSYGDETVEFRTASIDVKDGRAYVNALLSDDEGEYYRVEFDPANQSISASHDHAAEDQLKDDALLERLNLQVNPETLNGYLETVRFDQDCDQELYDAIGNSMSHEPKEEHQVPEALLREYFHSDNADILDVQVPESSDRTTVVVDVQDDEDGDRYTITADVDAGTLEVHGNDIGAPDTGDLAKESIEILGLPTDPEHYRKFHREFLAQTQE